MESAWSNFHFQSVLYYIFLFYYVILLISSYIVIILLFYYIFNQFCIILFFSFVFLFSLSLLFKAFLKLEHLFPSINHKKTLFFIYLYFFMFAYLVIKLFHSHWLIVCSSCLTLLFWHIIFMFKLNKATYRLQSLLIFKSLHYKKFFGSVFGELRLIKYFQTY